MGVGITPSTEGSGYPQQDWIEIAVQSCTANTCYAAGSKPLGFTQEDFLVLIQLKKVVLLVTT